MYQFNRTLPGFAIGTGTVPDRCGGQVKGPVPTEKLSTETVSYEKYPQKKNEKKIETKIGPETDRVGLGRADL
jgi:hypothetical protein